MLSMLTAQLPLILRLVAIAMTLTTDGASGCERLISLIHERLADRVPLLKAGIWTRMARRTRPGGRLLAVLSNCGGPLKWIG